MIRAARATGRQGPTARVGCTLWGLLVALSVVISFSGEAHGKQLGPPPTTVAPRRQTALAETRSETPEERLARGQQAYLKSDFSAAVGALQPLLYPEILLRSEEDVQSAHRLLALAFLLQHAEPSAEAEFSALLQLNPSFALRRARSCSVQVVGSLIDR